LASRWAKLLAKLNGGIAKQLAAPHEVVDAKRGYCSHTESIDPLDLIQEKIDALEGDGGGGKTS